jgi:hypothetical protein
MPAFRAILATCTLACALCMSVSSASLACPITYTAVIGSRDLQNSSGQNLLTLGGLVRQDRANYHKFSRRDPGDEADTILSDEKMREALENAVNRSDPDYEFIDPFYWDEEFGTVLSVTFWYCESPPRASVQNLGIKKPDQPHPAFDRPVDEDREREQDILPPPPE